MDPDRDAPVLEGSSGSGKTDQGHRRELHRGAAVNLKDNLLGVHQLGRGLLRERRLRAFVLRARCSLIT